MAGDASSGGGDPYATSKANLRDTVKWLGGIFGALAAAVVAGAPMSGLGSLELGSARMLLATAALLLSFVCICLALGMTLRILRADVLYESDIDPSIPIGQRSDAGEIEEIRKEIAEHANDLFPQYKTYAKLKRSIEEADQNAADLETQWQALRADAASTREVVDQAKADYDAQIAALRDFRALQNDVLYYAVYKRFYNRLQRATPRMFILGIGSLLLLTVFAVAAHKPEESKSPGLIVVPVSVAAAAPPALVPHAELLGDIPFSTGSAVVDGPGMALVGRARDAAVGKPDSIILLMAFTDTVGGKINTPLARQRAEAIRGLLIGSGGIAASRVFSSELPKASLPEVTGDQTPKASNRAVSVFLLPVRP